MTVNAVHLTARVTFEPKIKEFANGGRLATVGVCWNNNYFNKQKNDWENIPNYFEVTVQNDKLIDKVVNDLEVGQLINLNGQLRYRAWEDKDGQKRNAVNIYAFDIVKCDNLKAPEQKGSNGNDSDEDIGF